jgi:PA14 domain
MVRAWRIPAAAFLLAVNMAQTGAQEVPPTAPVGGLPADAPITNFGVTVVDSTGLEGKIYLLKPGADHLPNFKKMTPVGSIYTTALNIPPRGFTEGFPGVTDRFEWFAIEYTGKFWIENPATYFFGLLSDDGSKLYIDDKQIIDNDGIHPPQTELGKAKLSKGVHRIRVSYFQGPREQLALVLAMALPGHRWEIFNTKDLRPANPDDWKDYEATAPAKRDK